MSAPTGRTTSEGRDRFGRHQDGTEFPVEIGLTPVETAEGLMVLASIINISERKRVELEQARQRNELAHLSRVSMLGELSGSLAHELNQPLTAVLSNAQAAQRFLDRDPPNISEVDEILRDIVSESKRAGEVIHGLRLLLKKGEVEKMPLDMGELVQHALRLMRSDLINHGVTVSTLIEPTLPPVMGDQAQLRQVVLNLVMNASDAMAHNTPDMRQLTVKVRQGQDAGVLVSVIDRGEGIAPERHQLVFQPFHTTKETGMGLGLAVCRTIVGAHGGKLWVQSVPEGGAAFHLSLPAEEKKNS
jgi:C4-dicarboxylate-specific signal transduction histidine kinase